MTIVTHKNTLFYICTALLHGLTASEMLLYKISIPLQVNLLEHLTSDITQGKDLNKRERAYRMFGNCIVQHHSKHFVCVYGFHFWSSSLVSTKVICYVREQKKLAQKLSSCIGKEYTYITCPMGCYSALYSTEKKTTYADNPVKVAELAIKISKICRLKLYIPEKPVCLIIHTQQSSGCAAKIKLFSIYV